MTDTQAQSTTQINLSELFSRDPLKLSDEDLDEIIAELRKARAAWGEDEAKAKSEGKPTRSKAASKSKLSPEEASKLSVDDLLSSIQL